MIAQIISSKIVPSLMGALNNSYCLYLILDMILCQNKYEN